MTKNLELFLKSTEYKQMKTIYEKEYFKLFGKYCKRKSDNTIQEKTASEMAEKFKNKRITIEHTEEIQTKNGVISKKSKYTDTFFNIWSQDENIPEYDDIVFECNLKKVSKTDYNLFTGFEHFDNFEKVKMDIQAIYDHIESLTNYDKDDYEYVLNYFAHLVQKPETLPDVALILISKEGVGKDLLGEFLEKVIGEKYFGITEKLETLCGKFNSSLAGKLLYIINETNPIENAMRIENIKSMITAKKLEIEEKYKSPIKCSNFCRFIFFSNRVFAFPVEEGSRRPKIINCSDKYLAENYGKERSAKHFKNLAENYIKNEKVQYQFLRDLLKRDITNFNPREFKKSNFHQELEEISIEPIISFMAEYLDDDYNKNKTNLKINSTDLLTEYTLYLKQRNYTFEMTPKKFLSQLKQKFAVETIKSCKTYIVIDVSKVKKILVEKYKFNFGKEVEPYNPLDKGINEEEDKRNNITYLQEENEQLKNRLKELEELLKVGAKKEKKNKSIKEIKQEQETIKELELELEERIESNDDKMIKKLELELKEHIENNDEKYFKKLKDNSKPLTDDEISNIVDLF